MDGHAGDRQRRRDYLPRLPLRRQETSDATQAKSTLVARPFSSTVTVAIFSFIQDFILTGTPITQLLINSSGPYYVQKKRQ